MKSPWMLTAVCCGLGAVLVIPLSAQQAAPAEKQKAEEKGQTQPPRPAKDRWAVKTAADLDASEINRKPSKTTIEKLLAMPRPIDLPAHETPENFQNHRARPVETTVWAVEADVVDCRLMPDGDYRVTLQGASGKTLVMEMPKPEPGFVEADNPFFKEIKAAREAFDTKAKPEKTQKPLHLHARITGIGFWARQWNKSQPIKDNLIQMHPVLKMEWLDKPTSEFVAPPEPKSTNKK